MFKAKAVFDSDYQQQDPKELWKLISPQYSVDESIWLSQLLELATPEPTNLANTTRSATELIEQVRSSEDSIQLIDSMLLQYSLDTHEGILLMCLAEALMRVPDAETANALIRDKISVAEWEKHLKQSDSFLVNASTWGLLLTGKVVTLDQQEDGKPGNVIGRLARKMGEPLIRQAVNQAMKIMGEHFVLGRDINEALKNGHKARERGFTYSFDMLGEAALTATDAKKYYDSYLTAIKTVGNNQSRSTSSRPTISIKLSALHPRYEVAQEHRVLTELFDSVLMLIREARALDVGITIDAEEQDRLELSLKLFEKLYQHEDCQGWGKLGLVVQAYGKRALPVLSWLAALARIQGDQIPVRLVKGAYWDTEIKLCQAIGTFRLPGLHSQRSYRCRLFSLRTIYAERTCLRAPIPSVRHS